MGSTSASRSPFGTQLRTWRKHRGLSQLELAHLAETTPRHVSFIETGRSRPGRELILRLAASMDLPVRDRNALLVSAGLSPAFDERPLEDEGLAPFRAAVEAILERHMPYPAAAMNVLGRILLANDAMRRMAPGCEDQTPEESIDGFLGPGPWRMRIVNFAEVAWAWIDRQRAEATRTGNPQLTALVERGLVHLADVPRPPELERTRPAVICPRFRVGEQIISTFTAVLRFEDAREVTMSELKVELVFPADPAAESFFRELVNA